MMGPKSKHLPQRTCIACQQTKEKKALIRLVRTDNGVAEVDVFEKKPGRGAYLCPKQVCWELALKKNRLDHALRTKLSEDNRQILIEYIHKLLEES
ncbi:MAG TPA: YlxR family protein [Dehalococcoidia bacterium]